MAGNDHSSSYARTEVFINGIARNLNFRTNIKINKEILCYERTAEDDHRNSYARTTVFMNGITRSLNFTTNRS